MKPDQLNLPTPCSEWSLGELIAHLVAENRGFTVAMATLDGGRVGVAAQAVGIAQAAYDAARARNVAEDQRRSGS